MTDPTPTNPVVWFEIYVQDMERAKAFYEAVLAVKLTRLDPPATDCGPTPEMWAFPMDERGAGAGGALSKMEGIASGGNSTVVYFACADCAVEAGRVEPAGGRIVCQKFPIGQYGFIAIASDPDGNMIGLHSMT
jgi:predicted enzyme related to lactoylglutathione lyase